MAATKLLQRVEATIRSFYIFNSKFGQKEDEEHKKVLYYYPDDIEFNTKIKDVGLVEAILGFTTIFTKTLHDCKALHTQKTTQLFYQPEEDYWMVIAINVPKEIRTKDGVDITEYRGGEVHDDIYRNILKQCYNTFQLFEGTFQMHFENMNEEQGRNCLTKSLKRFFDNHLSTLKVPAIEIIDLAHSTQYLTLDKLLFLRSHNLINTICAAFPVITEAMLLFNEQVICSGKLNAKDLYCLHEYITMTTLNAATTTMEENNRQIGGTDIQECFKKGVYLTGNVALNELKLSTTQTAPKIYMRDMNEKLRRYYLIIYRTLNVTLCMLIESSSSSSNDDELENLIKNDFYLELHMSIGPHLSSLSSDISDMLNRKSNESITKGGNNKSLPLAGSSSSSSTSSFTGMFSKSATNNEHNTDVISPKFIFINEHSFKHISNIPATERRYRPLNKIYSGNLPGNILNLIADLFGQRNRFNNKSAAAFEEVQVKTTNEFWIVRRYCNSRQFYVVIFNNKSTLLDVTLEAKRIFEQELPYDVFFDE